MVRGKRSGRQAAAAQEKEKRKNVQDKAVQELESEIASVLKHAKKKNAKDPTEEQNDTVEGILANFLHCRDEGKDVAALEEHVELLRRWRDSPAKRDAMGRVAGEDGEILAGPKPKRGVTKLNTAQMAASLRRGSAMVEVVPEQPGIQLDTAAKDFLQRPHEGQDLIHVSNILQQMLGKLEGLDDQCRRLEQEMDRLKTFTTAAEHKGAVLKKVREIVSTYLTEDDCSRLKEFIFIEWIENYDNVDGFWKGQLLRASKSLTRVELDALDAAEILAVIKARWREMRNRRLVEPIRKEICQEFLQVSAAEAGHPNLSYNPADGAPKKASKTAAKKGPINAHQDAVDQQTAWIDRMDEEEVPDINELGDDLQKHCRIIQRVFGKHATFSAFCFYSIVFSQWRNGCNLKAAEKGESAYQSVQRFSNELKDIEGIVEDTIREAQMDQGDANSFDGDNEGVEAMEMDADDPLDKDKEEENE